MTSANKRIYCSYLTVAFLRILVFIIGGWLHIALRAEQLCVAALQRSRVGAAAAPEDEVAALAAGERAGGVAQVAHV